MYVSAPSLILEKGEFVTNPSVNQGLIVFILKFIPGACLSEMVLTSKQNHAEAKLNQ